MKEISIEQIAAVVGGRIVSGDPQKKIDNVQYDSRAVGAGSLFVPIVGENVDAHRFIPQCLEKGAAVFTQNDLSDEFQGEIIRVDNTLDALQRLAGWYRRRFTSLHFIGVTGSVGKTSTKEMIAAALSGGMNVMKTNKAKKPLKIKLQRYRIQSNSENLMIFIIFLLFIC